MNQLVLASGSPRRLSLLRECGLDPVVQPADIDERSHEGEAIADYVIRVARAKAETVFERLSAAERQDTLVLAADTMVVVDRHLCGKPANFAEACAIWRRLGGCWHEVWTGVYIMSATSARSTTVNTRVWMEPMTEQQMHAYWNSGEPQDKSGAYALQGLGGRWIRGIQGSYSNVVGLPLVETLSLLNAMGLEC